MQAIDRTTGKPIEVPDDQVQAAFQGGLISLPPDARIPIQRGTGEVGTVSAKDLDAELDAGAQVMPQADYQKAAQEAKYGGIGGAAIAAAEGVGRGLLPGMFDPGVIGAAGLVGGADTAESVRQHLAGEQQTNPIASTGGEVLGAVAPILATGGAAAPEELAEQGLGRTALEAATAVPRGITEASSLIERGVGAVVGDNSPNILARAAQKAVAKGAAGAFEGMVYNTGNQISEDALGDQDTTAEKLFAAAGHGAVFGALTGGGLGAIGGAGEAAIGKIARSPLAQRIAESEAWRSINPRKFFAKEAERIPGGYRSVGREMLDSGVIQAGDTVEDIAPRLEQLRADLGTQLGAHVGQVEDMGAAKVSIGDLFKDIRQNLPDAAKQLQATAGTMGRIDALKDDLARLADKNGEIGLRDLQSIRINLDTIINWEKANPSPALQALRSARSALEDRIMDHADAEATRLGMGADWKQQYQALKLRFRRNALADDAAQDAVTRLHGTNATSPTARLMGAVAGVGSLAAAAHPVGLASLATHAVGGAIATQVAKQVQTRGNATIAAWLDRAKDLAAVKQVTKRLDTRIATSISKAVAGKVLKPEKLDVAEYDDKVAQVRAAKLAHDEAIAQHLGSVQQSAPGVSGKFSQVARRATQLLYSKIPPQRPTSPFGDKDPGPTHADMVQFLKAERAVSHPEVVVKDILSGTLDQDTIDAVEQVYPHFLPEIRMEVAKQLPGSNLPYDRKLQISLLLGIDPDGTLSQPAIQTMQATWQMQQQKKPKGPPKPKKANVKNVGKEMSLSSRTMLP